MHKQCSEHTFEQVNDYIFEFSKEIKQQAFISGYTKASITVFEILKSTEIKEHSRLKFLQYHSEYTVALYTIFLWIIS